MNRTTPERPSRVHAVLNHVSIRLKLGAAAAFGVLVLLGLSAYLVWQAHDASVEARRGALREAVETASGVLQWAHGLERSGAVTRPQAQALARETLRGMRYSGAEYFWVNDMDTRVVMHPIKPELEGRDQRQTRDPEGVPLFVRFVETVRDHGAGYVAYQWPKPGQSEPVPKLSYVQGFAPWGWVVGTGLYVDDLRAALRARLAKLVPLVVVALLITAGMVHLVYESIQRGLDKASRVARAITRGDVSGEILLIGSDEIGDLIREMKSMADNLNATMGDVHVAATRLAHASAEIAAANNDLSERTEKTAANLQQTVASIGHLTASVERNAQASGEAEDTATRASHAASEGGSVVLQAVDTMHGISASSKEIAEIVGVIDGIAFQTNILALNASVEAARAGEQGRGFAVVASEVRMLAQRSAEAAKRIKALISASVERTEAGAELVGGAGTAMQGIVQSVLRVHELIAAISRSSREQSGGIGHINGAVAELDRMTQQNAALVEQSAAAAESLREQAQCLATVVSRFKIDIRTEGAVSAH